MATCQIFPPKTYTYGTIVAFRWKTQTNSEKNLAPKGNVASEYSSNKDANGALPLCMSMLSTREYAKVVYNQEHISQLPTPVAHPTFNPTPSFPFFSAPRCIFSAFFCPTTASISNPLPAPLHSKAGNETQWRGIRNSTTLWFPGIIHAQFF